jgi:DNA-binding PadR family transcriptional regulator
MRTKTLRPLSDLECALLGLLRQEPRSGYDLRKIFADTPFVEFSDSPGAVYPALQRLERRGFLEAVHAVKTSGRRRRTLRVTPKGLEVFREWLRSPVTRDAVVHHPSGLMLQFAFLEEVWGRAACVSFLRKYEIHLSAYLAELEAYLEPIQAAMTLSGKLAYESGLAGLRAQKRWISQALRRIQEEEK